MKLDFLNNLSVRYPVIFSIIVLAVYDPAMTTVLGGLTPRDPMRLSNLLISQLVLFLYVVSLLTLLKWWRESGFTASLTHRSLTAYLPWLILPLLAVTESMHVTAGFDRIIGFALFSLLVGFTEEGLLRGVILRALLPGGAMRAALLSALFFGVAHMSNMFHGQEAAVTIVQAIYATFIGIGFAGCRLYTGAIWPAIFMHGLIDFADIASRDFSPVSEQRTFTLMQAIIPIAVTGLFALYGWWLIRRYKRTADALENE